MGYPADIKHHCRIQNVPAPAKCLVVFVILLIGFFHECNSSHLSLTQFTPYLIRNLMHQRAFLFIHEIVPQCFLTVTTARLIMV